MLKECTMPRTRLALFAAFAVLILMLAGCSKEEPEITADDQVPADMASEPANEGGDDEGAADEGAADEGAKFEFVAEDIKFTNAPTEIAAGTATFELVNDGAILHDVTIEELDDETVVKAEGGQSATGTVELEAGDYTYYCSVPGHRDAGMEGTFTVA
jgi:plastocyanin